MSRFWHLICLLFFVININILIDESHDTIYKIINQNESVEYLYCLDLNEIIINKTKINLNEIESDLDYGLKWIQKNKKNFFGQRISNVTIEKIINQTKLRDYLIYQDKICFIFSNQIDFMSFSIFLWNLPIYQNYFIFNNKTFSFFKLGGFLARFNQISIEHKEYPYSGCSKDYSNFKCLNNKIKRIQPLSRYYYRSDDNESIELNYQINQTIIDNEIKVIKQCNQIDCNIDLLYSAAEIESIALKSFLCISNLDFYFQLIGLIVFFSNIPIYSFMIKIINSIDLKAVRMKILNLINFDLISYIFRKIAIKFRIKSKLNRIELLKLLTRKYLKINYLIRLILLICLAILFSRSIYNFIEERDYPSIKTISVDSIKPELPIVICECINDKSIYNRSLPELERDVDNFLDISLNDIYLEFLNKKIPTKWQLESKLIRFQILKLIGFYGLLRCFQLRIYLNQPKYQTIFSATKLIIEFKDEDIQKNTHLFILTDNEIFNSNSYSHNSYYNFRKRIFERSRLNKIKKCKDYNQFDDNCINKWNCIDRCKNRKIYNQIKNLTGHFSVDKSQFTDKEWSNLFIVPTSNDTDEIYDKINKDCEDKYSKLDPCVNIEFGSHSEINFKLNNKKEIDFNYEVIYHKEDEPSIFKLLLDLLNIQGNLFGLNFLSFSLMILGLFRLNLKLIKIIKLFIYLLCSIGFIYHLWSIYDEIINIEIIFSEHYEVINSIQPPDIIFCFNFNHTKLINQNYKLTYQYLDKITSDQLRKDQIFNKIEYLNKSYKWTKLDNRTNFQDDHLEIRTFYYLNRKCFKIVQKNIEYNRNQFEFNKIDNKGLVFKIFLNRTHLNATNFYFFTQSKYKIQFSKIEELILKDESSSKSFKIKHELIVRDEFELIKNPLSFLSDDQNDLDKFFNKLINYLDTELNLVTFKLPINKTDLNSHKEIDDNLFIQLYNQNQDQTNSNLKNLRKHSHNYLEYSFFFKNSNSIADLLFCLSFYRKVIVVSNKISLIKLLIDLLNVLSFWFNLGILDLDHYFFIFKLLPLQLCKLLIIIKNNSLSFIK